MTSRFQDTTINDTGYIKLPQGTSAQRPKIVNVVEQYTTAGTTSWTCPSGVSSVEVLVVAGGGGGGGTQETPAGAGGGAGGLIYEKSFSVTPSTSYTVTVGNGGAGGVGRNPGSQGQNSLFGSLTAIGGGGGGYYAGNGTTGGSGGGAAWRGATVLGQSGTPFQGNDGGDQLTTSTFQGACGGGGAGSKGYRAYDRHGGGGGDGLPFDITGSIVYYAGGGGGGGGAGDTTYRPGGAGGLGGGGTGGTSSATGSNGSNGTANTGGGGGGAAGSRSPYTQRTGGAGGSGIVIIRYSYVDNGIVGSELVTNGTFDTDATGWTADTTNGSGTTFSVSNGAMTVNRSGGKQAGEPYQALTTVVGKIYEFSVDISGSAMTFYVENVVGGSGYDSIVGTSFPSGNWKFKFQATSTTTYIGFTCDDNGTSSTVDNVSVKEVLSSSSVGQIRYNTELGGVEIYESPKLGWQSVDPKVNHAGHNRLTDSRISSFSTGQGLDVNSVSKGKNPFEVFSNVFRVSENDTATRSFSIYEQRTLLGNNTPTVFSVFAKDDGSGRDVGLYVDGITNGIGVVAFNLETGVARVITNQSGLIDYGSESYGDGWWRVWVTGKTSGSGTYYYHINTVERDNNSLTHTGSTSSGLYLHGAQIEQKVFRPSTFIENTATASTQPESNEYTYHPFTNDGTFVPSVTGDIEVLVIAGGGGGGASSGNGCGGGGGAGGVIHIENYKVIAGKSYPVVIGAGGAGAVSTNDGSTRGANGSNSSFGELIAVGGGGGVNGDSRPGYPGGSGGGGSGSFGEGGGRVVGQGHRGGTGNAGDQPSGGGGGAGTPGGNGMDSDTNSQNISGNGGSGIYLPQFANYGVAGWFAGGGGGGSNGSFDSSVEGKGGRGGGGDAGNSSNTQGSDATANTGSGGGGNGKSSSRGGNGASGIIIVRYRVS